MPLNLQQRQTANQFMTITGASDRMAQRYLKTHGYKLEQAIDSYFENNPSLERPDGGAKSALNETFDSLVPSSAEKNSIGLDATMTYVTRLGFALDDIEVLALFEIVQSPTIGQITRDGFVDGWIKAGSQSSQSSSMSAAPPPTDIFSQSKYIRAVTGSFKENPDAFRRVYRHTFVVGREENQRALNREMAVSYWDLLFGRTGFQWVAPSGKRWLDVWKAFLEDRWSRTVSRDMWNQTLEFAYKSVEDETLGFWSEDGAWPGVIDEFVVWAREKGHVPSSSANNNRSDGPGAGAAMDVDA